MCLDGLLAQGPCHVIGRTELAMHGWAGSVPIGSNKKARSFDLAFSRERDSAKGAFDHEIEKNVYQLMRIPEETPHPS